MVDSYEALGEYLENWVNSVPAEIDNLVLLDAHDALIEANMVQFNPNGWDFTLHQKFPEAPKSQFKLMIRRAEGVDTNPQYYRRFVLPSVLMAETALIRDTVKYVVGYPNAGTPIAAAFVELANRELGLNLEQLIQNKITYDDGSRELGDITGEFEEGAATRAVDDTTTGGATKIQGWGAITGQGLGYSGLSLIVERDPLGSALVRSRTGGDVTASMHWLSVVDRAAQVKGLPADAVQREADYSMRLFEWNVENGNTDGLPHPSFL